MRVVLLDLDDTLFDRGAAVRRWAARHLGVYMVAELAWLERADDRGRRSRQAFADDVITRYRLSDSSTAFAAQFPAQLAACVEPEPGVRELVASMADRVRVAIVTNGSSVAQREKLRRLGLDDVVHTAFVSGELGLAKPALAIFEHAIAWGGAAPAECLFVGDDPINDIVPAAALGMATAWRAREAWPTALPPPTHVITELAQILELVERSA